MSEYGRKYRCPSGCGGESLEFVEIFKGYYRFFCSICKKYFLTLENSGYLPAQLKLLQEEYPLKDGKKLQHVH